MPNTGKTFYGYSTFLETYRGVSFRLNSAVKSFQLPISKVQLLYFFYTYDLLLQLLKVRFDMSFAAFMHVQCSNICDLDIKLANTKLVKTK